MSIVNASRAEEVIAALSEPSAELAEIGVRAACFWSAGERNSCVCQSTKECWNMDEFAVREMQAGLKAVAQFLAAYRPQHRSRIMSEGQGPPETMESRRLRWVSIAEGHAKKDKGYTLYPGDWAALAAVLRAQDAQWRPISEAPNDGRTILLYYKDHSIEMPKMATGFQTKKDGWWQPYMASATHWREMPAPPSDPPYEEG